MMSITVFDNCRIFDGHGPEYIFGHAASLAVIMKAGEFVRRAGL